MTLFINGILRAHNLQLTPEIAHLIHTGHLTLELNLEDALHHQLQDTTLENQTGEGLGYAHEMAQTLTPACFTWREEEGNHVRETNTLPCPGSAQPEVEESDATQPTSGGMPTTHQSNRLPQSLVSVEEEAALDETEILVLEQLAVAHTSCDTPISSIEECLWGACFDFDGYEHSSTSGSVSSSCDEPVCGPECRKSVCSQGTDCAAIPSSITEDKEKDKLGKCLYPGFCRPGTD